MEHECRESMGFPPPISGSRTMMGNAMFDSLTSIVAQGAPVGDGEAVEVVVGQPWRGASTSSRLVLYGSCLVDTDVVTTLSLGLIVAHTFCWTPGG